MEVAYEQFKENIYPVRNKYNEIIKNLILKKPCYNKRNTKMTKFCKTKEAGKNM